MTVLIYQLKYYLYYWSICLVFEEQVIHVFEISTTTMKQHWNWPPPAPPLPQKKLKINENPTVNFFFTVLFSKLNESTVSFTLCW